MDSYNKTVVSESQKNKDIKLKENKSKENKNTTIPKTMQQLLQKYRIQKGSACDNITNTRIGNTELDIYGGKYSITEENYEHFLKLYYHDVFVKNQPEYLTETQFETGPILVDLDFRHNYDVTSRKYTQEHIEIFVDTYLDVFKQCFQLDNDCEIKTYIFQKSNVNRIIDDNLTKDGIHMIFSISCDHITQQIIRSKVISNIENEINKEDLELTNSWDKVFDEGISQGTTNWQLIGSRKPGNDAYRLTGIFTSNYDSSDKEFSTIFSNSSTFDMSNDIYKLSARYPHNEQPLLSNSCIAEHNEWNEKSSIKRSTKQISSKSLLSMTDFDPLSIRSKEQLDSCLKQYLDSISIERYKEYETYSYTMTLPEKYYGHGSYTEWFQVGCALRNTSNLLFIVWFAFSAQSPEFSFIDGAIRLWEQWQKFDIRDNGLTFRSIYYWSKKDAPQKFKEVRMNTLDYYVDLSLDNGLTEYAVTDNKAQGATDWEIAMVLKQLKKDEYVCADVKANGWYQYRQHRWIEIDSGTSLRMSISTELRSLYGKKLMDLGLAIGEIEEDDAKYKFLKTRQEKAFDIYAKLGRTSEKRNIMEAAKDLFHDEEFKDKIDTNPYLLCCGNGVWDFKNGTFRDGKPDDYVSMTTSHDYNPISEKDNKTVDEINDFMTKLFPIEELREYMWNHLASTLVGTAVNQTFNNYLGAGRNGKSVLVSLMTKVLGQYKGELPLTAVVTSKRTAVGGLSPEIASLKGKRYVVMQEPRQGDILNEGILKELTSGLDAIQARSLFSKQITFIPQFKLIVCANILPEIKAMDHGTWRRIRVAPFMSLFTENPVQGDPFKPYQYILDSTIDEKFDLWKTVFLAMLVERVLKTDGRVIDCDTVLKASNEYKQKQDVFSQFIEDKIERSPGKWLTQTHANQGFKIWHEDNFGTKGPQPKELHTYLDREFGAHIKKTGWKDVRLIYDNGDSEERVNSDDADF